MNSILEGMGFGVGFGITYWLLEKLGSYIAVSMQKRRMKKDAEHAAKYLSASDAQQIKVAAQQQADAALESIGIKIERKM